MVDEAQSRLQALLGNHAHGVIEVTASGSVSLVNGAMCNWIGSDATSLVGRELASLVCEDDHAPLRRQLDRLLDGSIDSTSVTHGVWCAGEMRLWVRSTWSARRSPSGAISHLIAIVEDISQERLDGLVRSILEASIRELEQRRRVVDRVIGGLPVIAWQSLHGGICRYVSPQWSELTHAGNASGLAWLASVHPDDRAAMLDALSCTNRSYTRFSCRLSTGSGTFEVFEAMARLSESGDAWHGVFIPRTVADDAPYIAADNGNERDALPNIPRSLSAV